MLGLRESGFVEAGPGKAVSRRSFFEAAGRTRENVSKARDKGARHQGKLRKPDAREQVTTPSCALRQYVGELDPIGTEDF